MPSIPLNVVFGVIFTLSAIFFGLHFLRYLNVILSSVRKLVTYGIEIFPAHNYYAFGRIVISMSLCAAVCFSSTWPNIVTYLIGAYLLRAFDELWIAIRGNGLYAASMFIFYENVIRRKLIGLDIITFLDMTTAAVIKVKEGDQSKSLDTPLSIIMKIHASDCSGLVKRRAIISKASSLVYLAIAFAISGYFLGF